MEEQVQARVGRDYEFSLNSSVRGAYWICQ